MKKAKGAVLHKFGFNSIKKSDSNDEGNPNKWVHAAKDIQDSFVTYNAKYLGNVEVSKPRGVDVVKEAIKKLKIARQVKKSEVGHKGSKLLKVELCISIDALKVIETKSRSMICNRPLHRVSYCADDHTDKRLFAFIAKDQETKKHNCFVLICEKEAAELTLTLGQAFQMAYKRYIVKEKLEIEKNKEVLSLEKQIEEMKNENILLQTKMNESLSNKKPSLPELSTSSMFFNGTLSQSSSSPPNTPFFQHNISNPLPSSPLPNISLDTSLEARFDYLWVNRHQESVVISTNSLQTNGIFDPFGNHSIIDGKCMEPDNSMFSSDNFNTSHTNGEVSAFSANSNFDIFSELSSSPTEQDFQVKDDPFADIPDWNSVASEEINTTPIMNPFSDVNTIQLPDQPSLKLSVNPFTHVDDANSDLFSQYLSNVVASREAKVENSTSKVLSMDDLCNDSSVDVMNSEMSNSEDSFFNAKFDDHKGFETEFTQLHLTNNNNEVNKAHSFDDNANQINNTEQTVHSARSNSQTFRPRPTGSGVKSQTLPAPPTKQAIKSTSILPPPKVTKTPRKLSSDISVQQNNVDKNVFQGSIVLSSHVLPNVNKTSKPDIDIRSRSRTISTTKRAIQPIKDSISQASKNLEDLVGLDSSNNSFSNSTNPFSGISSPNTIQQRSPEQNYFQDAFNSPTTDPSFMNNSSYASFEVHSSFSSSESAQHDTSGGDGGGGVNF